MRIASARETFQNLHNPANKKITLPFFEVRTTEIIDKFTVKGEKINFKVNDKGTRAFCEHSNSPLTIPSAIANTSNIEGLTTILNAHYISLSIDNILKFYIRGIGGAIVGKNDKNISILDFTRPIGEILDKEHIIDADITKGDSYIFNALALGIYQLDKETRKKIYSNMRLADFNQFDLEDLHSKSSEKVFNKNLSNHLKRYAEKLTTLNNDSNHVITNISDDKMFLTMANSLGIVLEIYNDEDKILLEQTFEHRISSNEITSHSSEYNFFQAGTASYTAAKLAGFVATNEHGINVMFNHKLYLNCENLIEEKVKHFRELINNNWGKSKDEWITSKSTSSGMRKYTEKLDIDFNVMKEYFDKKLYSTKNSAINALNDDVDGLADKIRRLLHKKFRDMPFIVIWNREISGKRYYQAINLQKLLDTCKVKKNGLEEKSDVTERKQSEIISPVVEPEQKEVTRLVDITLSDFKYPIRELLLEEHMLSTSGNSDMCGYYALALGIRQFSSEARQKLYSKIGLKDTIANIELLVEEPGNYQLMLGEELKIFAEKCDLIRDSFNNNSREESHKTNIEANTLIAIANFLQINLQLFQGSNKSCHLDGTSLKIANQDLKCLKSYVFTEICKHIGVLYKDENGSYSLNYSSDIIYNRDKSINDQISKAKSLIKTSFDNPQHYRELLDNKMTDDGWAEDLIKKYSYPKYKSSHDAIKVFEEDTKQLKENVDDLFRRYTPNSLPLIIVWNIWGNANYGHYQTADLQKLLNRDKATPTLESLRTSNAESNTLEEKFDNTQPSEASTTNSTVQPNTKQTTQNVLSSVDVEEPITTSLSQGAQFEEPFESKELAFVSKEVASYISLETNRVNILKAGFTDMLSWFPDINCTERQFLNRIVGTIDLEIAVNGGIKEDTLVALDTFLNNDDSQIDIIYDFLEEGYLSLLLQPFKGENIPSNSTIVSFFKEITRYIESGIITKSHLRDYIEVLIKYGNEVPKKNKDDKVASIADLIKGKPEFYACALKAVLDNAGDIKYDIFKAIYSGTNLVDFLNQGKDFSDLKLWAHAANDFKMFEIINELLLRLLPDKEQHKKIELFWAQTRLDRSNYSKALKTQISEISQSKHKAILFEYFLNICLNNKILTQILYEEGPLIEELRSLVSEFINVNLKKYDEQFNKNICNPFLIKFCSYFRRLERECHDNIAIPLLLSLIIHTNTEEMARFRDFENTFANIIDALQFVFANLSNYCFNGAPRKLLEQLLLYIKDVFNIINAPCKIKLDILKSYLDAIMYIKLDDVAPKNDMTSEERIMLIISEVQSYLDNYSVDELSQRVNKLQNRLFHFLCRQRYSFDDFRGWFDGENPDLALEIRRNIINNMETTRKEIGEDDKVLKNHGFEYIHHNQISALTAIGNYIDRHNIFLKLATGQGKSLIAEYAAIQMLEKDFTLKRVFIFTTYDHLAKRDQANMEFLCEAHNINTLYVGSTAEIEKIPLDWKTIIHVDADTFDLSLGKFLTNILDGNLSNAVIERFKKIYDPSNCAAILDEGDLMLLDNRGSSYVHNFQSLFGLNKSMKMQADRKQFEGVIGADFIKRINQDFGGAFDKWYHHESSRSGGEKKGMDNASGKIIIYADTFADKLSQGQFQAFPGETNMVAYVRNFKHIVVLSGSLEDKHIRLFDGAFGNEKEKPKQNLFIKIPVFYGSHNRGMNLKSITEKCGLRTYEEWFFEIDKDIKKAVDRKQPVLAFCGVNKIPDFKARLETKFPKQKIQVIDKESQVEDGEKTTGESNTITLATTIMGRGVDIKVSKHIKDGLHVVVTELPNDNNDRLLTQECGRTARLDNKGTFSIIVQDSYDDFKTNSEKHQSISVSRQKNFLLYEVTKYFLDLFSNSYEEARKNIAKRWVIFFLMLKNGYIKENDIEEVKNFIRKHVVKN